MIIARDGVKVCRRVCVLPRAPRCPLHCTDQRDSPPAGPTRLQALAADPAFSLNMKPRMDAKTSSTSSTPSPTSSAPSPTLPANGTIPRMLAGEVFRHNRYFSAIPHLPRRSRIYLVSRSATCILDDVWHPDALSRQDACPVRRLSCHGRPWGDLWEIVAGTPCSQWRILGLIHSFLQYANHDHCSALKVGSLKSIPRDGQIRIILSPIFPILRMSTQYKNAPPASKTLGIRSRSRGYSLHPLLLLHTPSYESHPATVAASTRHLGTP
ncbi:hypothetical protein BD626DRAFT_147499 [Schizophyllum amplum]|uniref:Uncharacterized protein n=1 Tax=Schizophyllum amplum TaxID=97359 RepID=A0A550C4Q9_9AGAR|nr:hypothetical protein BD626DRAFT_147499 [Auriculariopsis ampla]